MELLVLPLVFLLISLFVPKSARKVTALIGSTVSVVFSVIRWTWFDPQTFVEIFSNNTPSFFRMTYQMGYDGLGLAMILLTNIIILLIFLANYENNISENKLFNAMVFLMQFSLIGVFTSFDLILFYVFWEISLLPVFLIAFWFGEKDRKKTLILFFIYTFIGSLCMLYSVFYLGTLTNGGNYDYQTLLNIQMDPRTAMIVAFGFLMAFGVKIPLVPLHSWQPGTYTKSPMAGTLLLAALMLKMALYGIFRWLLPLTPEAYGSYKYIVIILGVIGVVYAAIIAIKRTDMKAIFAYASISHVGLIAAGTMILTMDAFTGAIVQMVNHAFVAVGMFLAADVIERRLGTRDLHNLGGIAVKAPHFGFWFAVVVFGAIAVPFTSGFIGEFFLIKAIFLDNYWIGGVAALTLILAAVYMYRAYQKSMFGPEKDFNFRDLTWSETSTFALVTLVIITLGLYPQLLIDLVKPSLDHILTTIIGSSI